MEFKMLTEVIAEVLSVDPAEITRDTTFEDDLGADSLDLFQIIMEIEDRLDLKVDSDLMENIKTVGQAEELIKKTTSNA